MNAIWKKVTSAALAAFLLLGALPAVPARADDAQTAESVSTPTVRASFAKDAISVNGKFNDGGWALATRAAGDSLIGAQWDAEKLYLGVYTMQKEDISVTLNGTKLTKSNATMKSYTVRATGKTSMEIAVPFSAIGTEVKDYSVEIPAEITIGDTVWTGPVVLTSTEWFAVDNPSASAGYAGLSTGGNQIVHEVSKPTSNQGIATIAGGYKLFDRYSAKGDNPPSISSQLVFQGDKYAAVLSDRTADSVIGFTFCANSMPVYPLGTDNDFFPYVTTCGLNWYMTSKSPAYEELPYVTMAIINTDVGLVFVVRDADRDRTYILNKFIGDKFYIETVWTKEGDLILSIDGEQVAFFDEAEMSRWDLGENLIYFNLLRNKESAKSEKDNFDIDITGICVGKSCGETLLDSLTFDTISNTLNKPLLVNYNLDLVTTFANQHFTTPVAIEWESSNPDVIDPATGKVTRPETDGKSVTLTATAPSTGSTTSIDVYVQGLNPQTDVLVVRGDINTSEGRGTVPDAPYYTFDEANNSIVRDLKESKTVNVIALKDSDDSCRLNESNLTIWVSDDNKTYTQVKPFKLLRDGQYTYLYDFEATGRYIKVHFTLHTKTDTTFTAPIPGMIDAYYEDVFGAGGTAFSTTSAFEVKNESDSAMMDVLTTVLISETGAKCLDANYADIRFLLGEELLYHAFDGEKFLVRIPDIPAGESVTVTVLSGNADAKDISNIEPLYEVMYGTRETSSDYHPGGFRLNNGLWFATQGQGLANTGFAYFFSENNARSMSKLFPAGGTYDVLTQPMGAGYDDVTGRIFVQGVNPENGKNVFKIMYSDNNGKLWTEAEIHFERESDRIIQSYDDIIKVSAYDGEGPNVDFVLVTCRPSAEMEEYYGHQYEHAELFSLYSTDGGKTWETSTNAVRFFGGDDTIHKWEHGLCEQVCMETADGVLVAYSRLQYENILHFGYAFSYDFGKTWTEEAELSNIYTTNTQPVLFKADGHEFILWGGNNVYGGGSYRRYPMNVAISYDNLLTFTAIQDIFLRTDYQGMVNGTCINAMNPNITMFDDGEMHVTVISDDTMGGERFRNIWVSDFTDFFFRTKGAYDSFENSTTEYEGWATTGGQVETSDAQASVGEKSLMFTPGAAAVRSLPEVKDGKIAFDLYIEDVTKANLTLELEASHGPDYGKASPIGFSLYQDQLTLLGGDVIMNAVKNGWNHFEFDLALTDSTPNATLAINGGEAVSVPVNAEVGAYVCYVHVVCKGALTYYLDEFVVEDVDGMSSPRVEPCSVPGSTDSSSDTDPSAGTPGTDDPAANDGISPIVWIAVAAVVILAVVFIAVKSKKKSA